MKLYALILLVAVAATAILTPVVRQIALVEGIFLPVRERDVHTVPTPRFGGIAMTAGFVISMLIAAKMPYFADIFADSQAWPLIWGAVAMCLLGAADDRWDLGWLLKFSAQALIVVVMVWNGVVLLTFPIFGGILGSHSISVLATCLIILGTVNAVNFVDGLDGLAAGILAIGAAAFFVYSYFLSRVMNAASYASLASLACVVLVGICAGFLLYNFHPATIFMGDSGAMVLGLLISSVVVIVSGQLDPSALESHSQLWALLPLAMPFAVIFLPMLDMVMAVVRRVGNGKSPFHPDKMHLHHRLLRLGHSHRRTVLLLYLWSAVIALSMASALFLDIYAIWLVLIPLLIIASVATVGFIPQWREKVKHAWKHES
ncbi:undecaprenyl-phosphate alpha-N-acetylglucosaminyl 1-phosphate transferase [Boudabousia tangfeifanii]|uniref:Undecaprenyl-phosphate alpha-N-acetylglucosaminyl 1-phosphate transferase n=1 Tax=Boudabousia tangfeifanii TaxID=1912795 RepID=A0A1D9MJZ9_9ACTO|nr:MraY family glycosyltransferase [Boudabousia tangfeifanii]AOZ72500.1 undecaprenyl-phosphate alpha-N-acetylglucosaminyl 1-phosphate transferase [Boudabousia tangfeifanii]